MANKKKNQLTTSPEWAKHLRKIGKRFFWKSERLAEKKMIVDERVQDSTDSIEKLLLIEKKLALLKNLDKNFTIFGAKHHQYKFDSAISEQEIMEFEAEHSVLIPSEYRIFVLKFGNGGCGPFYGLLSLQRGVFDLPQNPQQSAINKLSADFRFDSLWNAEDIDSDTDIQQNEYDDAKWCDGLLRICHEGCGYFINLVITGEQRGSLWLDGRVSEAGIFPLNYYDSGKKITFLDWYLDWLDTSIDYFYTPSL